jgi:hypothetical protein
MYCSCLRLGLESTSINVVFIHKVCTRSVTSQPNSNEGDGLIEAHPVERIAT